MKTVFVRLRNNGYKVVIGRGISRTFVRMIAGLGLGDYGYIITNPLVKAKCGVSVSSSLSKAGMGFCFKVVPDTEQSKSFKTAGEIISDIAVKTKQKKFFIIALGGGVIGDLAGFVASMYKRGVPYVQVPTTLLSQVDSSIGGKTAVDISQGKNLVGSFYQPRLVLSDVSFLSTLSKPQVRNGLSEVIKYAIIKDPGLFSFLEQNYSRVINHDLDVLEYVVATCAAVKARIVEKDERETKGIRTILNFGHTLGHAIEAAGGYERYSHGEAIAVGMLLAVDMSVKIRLVSSSTAARIEALICSSGLPTGVEGVDPEKIIRAHYYDKKFSGAKNKFVLISGIGKTQIVTDVPLPLIKEVILNRCR
ncbi:MAG: 3-dehydroquinate synthase [Candidatus Omnitrophica bacterium]|nr:3-dehydroquinate synthase [Candidatus Omnitrophota bacterium]